MITLTDVTGILKDKNNPSSLIKAVTLKDAEKLFDEGIISGGMIPKVECCMEAVKRGVDRVFITDGRIPHAILVEMLTDEGTGTMFTA
jgi:acetylglutamate kinase